MVRLGWAWGTASRVSQPGRKVCVRHACHRAICESQCGWSSGSVCMYPRHALWHIWQTAPNNGWSNWQPLGGGVVGAPVAIENADRRLEVFVRGTDWKLWHIWQIFQ